MSVQQRTIQCVLNNPNRCQSVIGHRLIFCQAALSMPTDRRILECECCRRFLGYCCSCTERRHQEKERNPSLLTDPNFSRPCHHYKLAFVDGACLGNGQDGATAGIGVAIGVTTLSMQWAIPIDDLIDPSSIRTSQRAELLAAIHGLHKLAEHQGPPTSKPDNVYTTHRSRSEENGAWVIASDSEYVVSGMTEWVPTWKNNGWRNSSKKRPKNFDLFRTLDAVVEQYELEYDIQIAFWHISREDNMIADGLAGIAAGGQTLEENLQEAIDSMDDPPEEFTIVDRRYYRTSIF